MTISALIIGLIVGWLACKLLADAAGRPIKSVEEVRSSASSAIDAAVESTSAIGSAAARATEGLAGKAAGAAGTVAQKAADSANAVASKVSSGGGNSGGNDLSETLFETRKSLDEKDSELRQAQAEIDAAQRTVTQAKHQAGNHAATISSLRDEVAELSKKLKEAEQAARK